MPNLCFKTRKNGRTAQLVRHTYNPACQRSRTVTLGSIPIDANPDDFQHELRLRPGVVLCDAEYHQISVWLAVEGDAVAARRRKDAAARMESRVRAAVAAELAAAQGDALTRAVAALGDASRALPQLVAAAQGRGEDAWTTLRPRYLAILAAWGEMLKTAQVAGVAKRTKRTKGTRQVSVPG